MLFDESWFPLEENSDHHLKNRPVHAGDAFKDTAFNVKLQAILWSLRFTLLCETDSLEGHSEISHSEFFFELPCLWINPGFTAGLLECKLGFTVV